MTGQKNATKEGAARRPRLTKAEIAKRVAAQEHRENISLMGDHELSNAVRDLAFKQPELLDHEMLLIAASRLADRPSPQNFTGGGE